MAEEASQTASNLTDTFSETTCLSKVEDEESHQDPVGVTNILVTLGLMETYTTLDIAHPQVESHHVKIPTTSK